MVRQIAPVFFTTDMAATLAYYRDKLGFECVGTWMDPPVYAIVARDGFAIHFRCAEPPRANPDKYRDELLDAYVSVEDDGALYGEYAARGVEFTRELGDTPWGSHEFVARDCDGRLVAFGAPARRRPTSHERMAGQPWDASYGEGAAPWDIGRPQPAIVRVVDAGGFAGAVLDAGCGTGENALYVASKGLRVMGVDVAETALAMARAKAAERGIEAEFQVADALHLERLGRRFTTVMDCGLFHAFDREEREEYVVSLGLVMEDGGVLYVLCFGDEGEVIGPHPVSEEDLRAAFRDRWEVESVERERILTRFHEDGAAGWLARVRRLAPR